MTAHNTLTPSSRPNPSEAQDPSQTFFFRLSFIYAET